MVHAGHQTILPACRGKHHWVNPGSLGAETVSHPHLWLTRFPRESRAQKGPREGKACQQENYDEVQAVSTFSALLAVYAPLLSVFECWVDVLLSHFLPCHIPTSKAKARLKSSFVDSWISQCAYVYLTEEMHLYLDFDLWLRMRVFFFNLFLKNDVIHGWLNEIDVCRVKWAFLPVGSHL